MTRIDRISPSNALDALVPPLPTPVIFAILVVAMAVQSTLFAHGGEECLDGKLERWQERAAAGWDETTGRDLRNFPPDRLVDHLHMRLEMRFEDLEEPRFTAVERLRIKPIGVPTRSLTLDAVGLEVDEVTLDDASGNGHVEHFQDDETITLRFDPPLSVGQEREIVFRYTCIEPWDGLFFSPTSKDVPGYTAEVHTQGQSITNRHWFIAHDSPNERMTTELVVDVPAGYLVSSNGKLVSHAVDDGRGVWHWLQDKPHVSYLVTLVIGKFDVVEIPHRRVPMKVWVPEGLGGQVMQTYGMTGRMIDVFEQRFGVPYPWDRYDQLCAKGFGAGGMENTGATTMYPTAILDETALADGDLESLIAHELAHQWTGDLLTCKEWAHIWLNEGFATYGEALWFEARDGKDGYLDDIRGNFRVARRDQTTDPVGMVSGVYESPGETFGRRANPYPKGASILHMLRMKLGEDVFWKGMHLYINRHKLGTVETDDFRLALEEVSGRGLEGFFEQWCYRPGSPRLSVKVEYDAATRALRVDLEQTQTIDERTPAFRFTLPVHVLTEKGHEVHELKVSEKNAILQVVLDGVPEVIAIDPELHVLSVLDVEKPLRMWKKQVRRGPTIVARHRAITALGEHDTPEHRRLLATSIRDDATHVSLRKAAVASLTRYGSDEAKALVLDLLDEGIGDPKVRSDLVEALSGYERDTVEERLATIASTDPSYATRVAAIEGLAALEAGDQADLIAELVDFPSQHDSVRRAALSALADFDDPRGLELGMKYGAYGWMDRARPAAIAAVGTLAAHDADAAVPFLIDLLDDPHGRPARSAARALAETGDERGVAPLEAIAETHPNPGRRRAAESALERLREKMSEGDGDDERPRRRRGRRGF